jgi:hypothetical protein
MHTSTLKSGENLVMTSTVGLLRGIPCNDTEERKRSIFTEDREDNPEMRWNASAPHVRADSRITLERVPAGL